MAFLEINGVEVPPPKRGVSMVVTTVVDAGRNANGVVVGQKVGRDQYKIDNLEWPWLTASEWSNILQLFNNFFVTLTFYDPATNTKQSIQVYPGDRTAEPYWIDANGKPTHYRNCKVNIIDTGG